MEGIDLVSEVRRMMDDFCDLPHDDALAVRGPHPRDAHAELWARLAAFHDVLLLALGLCRAPSALDAAPPPAVAEEEDAKDPHYDPVVWDPPKVAPAAPGGKGGGGKGKKKDRRRSSSGARAP